MHFSVSFRSIIKNTGFSNEKMIGVKRYSKWMIDRAVVVGVVERLVQGHQPLKTDFLKLSQTLSINRVSICMLKIRCRFRLFAHKFKRNGWTSVYYKLRYYIQNSECGGFQYTGWYDSNHHTNGATQTIGSQDAQIVCLGGSSS